MPRGLPIKHFALWSLKINEKNGPITTMGVKDRWGETFKNESFVPWLVPITGEGESTSIDAAADLSHLFWAGHRVTVIVGFFLHKCLESFCNKVMAARCSVNLPNESLLVWKGWHLNIYPYHECWIVFSACYIFYNKILVSTNQIIPLTFIVLPNRILMSQSRRRVEWPLHLYEACVLTFWIRMRSLLNANMSSVWTSRTVCCRVFLISWLAKTLLPISEDILSTPCQVFHIYMYLYICVWVCSRIWYMKHFDCFSAYL